MNPEGIRGEDEQTGKKSARKILFGCQMTDEDRQEMEQKLQELSEESRKKFDNYTILEVIHPKPIPAAVAEPEAPTGEVENNPEHDEEPAEH